MLRSMFSFEALEDEHTNRSQSEERPTERQRESEREREMVNYYVETFKCLVCARLNMVRYDFH